MLLTGRQERDLQLSNRFGAVDFNVPPSERHGVASEGEIAANIEMRAPGFIVHLRSISEELHVTSRRFFTETTNQAAVIVGNHSFNDYDSFSGSLISGDGRSAARTARSLFEHLVNYCEVSSSRVAAERYLAHSAVTADLLGNLTHGLNRLSGKKQKQERNRLAKLRRDSTPLLRSAMSRFGTGFRRDWSARNLYDRAKAHGYENHYDTYRLLSQVTHGSRGGILGSHSTISGRTVHRIGPSLDLAILSYLEGFTFFRQLSFEMGAHQNFDTHELVAALDSALGYWPTYREALLAVDRQIWPSMPPPGPVAIMALYPNGRVRWLLWEPTLHRIKPANPPTDNEFMEKRFRVAVQSGDVSIPEEMHGRPVTSAVHGVQVSPKSNTQWASASGIFLPTQEPTASWVRPF